LVQGDALGGGFECALADDVIIAERGAKFGLPEVLFGLFPGMGAYSFLSRKIGDALAERMMVSGHVYTAEDLYDLGLVTMLADPGNGEAAVHTFIKSDQRAFRARTALSRIRQQVEPVTRKELLDITDTWVEAALTLSEGDLKKMRRLASAQDRRLAQSGRSETTPPYAAEA
jgi:DSF synthase